MAAIAAGVPEETKIEEEVHDEEDDSQRRRKRVKKSHDKENSDGAGVYQAHPLTIVLQIFDDEQTATDKADKANKLLTIVFEFLPKLNIVCAGIEGASQGPEPGSLLTNLFPNDTGLDLPNQVSLFTYRRYSSTFTLKQATDSPIRFGSIIMHRTVQ